MPTTTPLKAQPKGTVESASKIVGTEVTQIVTLNGSEIVLREAAETKFEQVLTLHSKHDRAALDKKSRLALIASATEKNEETYFKALTLTLDAESKLDDCYNISRIIENVAERHIMFDMHDVFSIVVPLEDGKTLQTNEVYNLYTDYASVSIQMVANSNTWYHTWPQGPTWSENLAWTDRFFKNNTSPELAEKVNEVYSTFPSQARGGPLFFAIMMEQVLSQTEEAVFALQTKLKKMDLKAIPGENVDKAVSLARAAILRLETFGKIPEDLIRNLLRIFQTSSVPAFNDFFKHLEQQRKVEQAMSIARYEEKLTAAGIFRAATTQYRSLWEEGLWTGTKRVTDAVFTNVASKGCCWNCGERGHNIGDCKLPKDTKRINANKRAQKKAIVEAQKAETKKEKKGKKETDSQPDPTGKYKPPTPEEHNRRVIDGKHMWYNTRLKRWYPDRKHSPAAASTAVATPTSAPMDSVVSSTTQPSTAASTTSTNSTISSVERSAVHTARQAYASAYATAMNQLSQVGL